MKTITIKLIVAALVAMFFVSCSQTSQPEANPRMHYRDLGATGIKVSEIGLGCGPFEEMTPEEARAYMDVALDSGINYIDIYDANPTVRGNIGYALKDRRDRMVIQGHVGCFWNGQQYERTRNVEQAKKGFVDLLDLLGTDHIEVGMLHIVDKLDEWDTILNSQLMNYIRQLKTEGKIKHIGMSSHNVDVALAAAKSGEFEVIMFSLNPAFDRITSEYNLWDKDVYSHMLPGIDPKRVELYDYCAQHNIAITVMKVFGGGGRLLKEETSPLGYALTPSQCLAYALSKPCVAVALAGANTIEILQEDLHYLTATDEEKDYLSVLEKDRTAEAYTNEAGNQCDPESATVASTQEKSCTYCGHCTPCPVGINIAKVNHLLDQAQGKSPVPANIKEQYEALDHHASECIGCGACENRCPFDVPIRQRMQQAVKVFGK